MSFRHIHHEPDFPESTHRSLEKQLHVFELAPLPRIGPGGAIRNQLRIGFEDRFDDPQLVCPERRSGFRDLDDRIREFRRFHLRRTPTELHLGLNAS